MQFGAIDSLILFGGGRQLVDFISVAKNYKSTVVSAIRLLNEQLYDGRSLRTHLETHGVNFFDVESLSSAPLDACLTPQTLGVSFGAPWIFHKNIIRRFQGRLINNHGTQLPKNRGGATYSWQIMRGDRSGCHLFHLIDERVDTGNIIFSQKFEFPDTCRTPLAYQTFFEEAEAAFFQEFLEKLSVNADFNETIQDGKCSTYFPRLSTLRHGFVNWSWKVQEIEYFIRAFDEPYNGASSFLNGERVFLRGAICDMIEGAFHPFMSGLVYRIGPGRIFLAVRDGSIVVHTVHDAEGIDITNTIRVGSRFVTPSQYLDDATEFKAVYDGRGLKD